MGGLAVGFMSLLRLNITVAILNMVNQTRIYVAENPEADLQQYFGEHYVEVGEFDWSNEIQQLIISYYMIAYTVSACFENLTLYVNLPKFIINEGRLMNENSFRPTRF